MVYFDNAATGGFKPRAVTDSAATVMRYLCANPGRSGHRLSVVGSKTVESTRSLFAEHFSCPEERVIFTKNCTESLNLAFFGSLKAGGHVITTVFEHNSVLRPLTTLKERGLITLDIVCPEKDKDIVLAIKEKICPATYMIVSTAVSNVTGESLPIKQIGALAKENSLLFIVDGAQGGGHVDMNMKDCSISMLALAGHKGLFGIMGSGVLLIEDGLELHPLIMGGTGSETFNLNQPSIYPERLEAGTLNLPSIAALGEGLKFVQAGGDSFLRHLKSMTEYMISELEKLDRITVFSSPNQSGIVSFSVANFPSTDVADILNSDYDIAVRGGFHCAPLMHKYLGTDEFGLIRASLAVQNSSREISYFIKAVSEITRRGG